MKAVLTVLVFLCAVGGLKAGAQSPPGSVIGWGNNISGEAAGVASINDFSGSKGIRSAQDQLGDVVDIAAGFSRSLALRRDGTVTGWGNNQKGAAIGQETTNSIFANGDVIAQGRKLTHVRSIKTGREFGLALKDDGTLCTWGENYVPVGMSNVNAIAAGPGETWAVVSNSTLVHWTSDPNDHHYREIRKMDGFADVFMIAVGPSVQMLRGLALKKDGTLISWGQETDYNDATPPKGLNHVTSIAVGPSHSLALKDDGTVVGWGFNREGEATGVPTSKAPYVSSGLVTIEGQILTNVVAIAAGEGMGMSSYSMALKRDGTITGWGRFTIPPAGVGNIVAISAGEGYCLAITTNQAVAKGFGVSIR